MKPTLLHSLSILTSREAEDAVAELLLRETGQSAVATHSRITGLSTVAVFLTNVPSFPSTRRAALRRGLEAIAACDLDTQPGRIVFRRVAPADWRESWKRHFKPLAIGHRLLIRPSWSRRRPRRDQAEIILDPGLSFGTGQHPTTEFCLRELVRLAPRRTPGSLLDVGTGSGILAIAAAKLGYVPVRAFDFDPEAVEVARRNATDNRVADRLRVRRDDVARLPASPRRGQTYDVVCANLTADLLQRHADRLLAQVVPGGHLVLAGILAEEFDAVSATFHRAGLTLIREAKRKEWRSGSFQRPAP